MTQIVLVGSPSALRTAAAAVDEGRLGSGESQRRILVTYSGSYAPETTGQPCDGPGSGPLLKRFDQVVSWNQIIYPYHPGEWTPHRNDALVVERLLRERWSLGTEQPELVLESIGSRPALTLALIFASSPISVVSAGLLTYGPTGRELPRSVAPRIERLHFVDLVEGLRPTLLIEHGVPPQATGPDALRAVTAEVSAECTSMADTSAVGAPGRVAIVLGHHLTPSDGIAEAAGERLLAELVVTTGRVANSTVVLKHHPDTSRRPAMRVVERARQEGVHVEIIDDPLPAEVLCDVLAPELVASCLARGLLAAGALYNLPVAGFGTGTVLAGLSPYEHRYRIPTAVVHAFAPVLTADGFEPPRVSPDRVPTDGQRLIEAIAYCMQPESLSDMRSSVAGYVGRVQHDSEVVDCIGRGRLNRLELLLPANPLRRQLTRAASKVGRVSLRTRRTTRKLRSRLGVFGRRRHRRQPTRQRDVGATEA